MFLTMVLLGMGKMMKHGYVFWLLYDLILRVSFEMCIFFLEKMIIYINVQHTII